jgi:hypothetical protein
LEKRLTKWIKEKGLADELPFTIFTQFRDAAPTAVTFEWHIKKVKGLARRRKQIELVERYRQLLVESTDEKQLEELWN